MSNEYDVSVIVPVYNGESFLPATLGNILNQTKEKMEIILVNDASTDNSLRILNDAKAQFPKKVKIINLKENKGPGVARNKGLDVATGEYIGFVDCDDVIDISMYEKLYSIAKKNDYDIVDCAYFRDSTGQALIHISKEYTGELNDEKRNVLISCGGYNCMKIFKRSLIEEKQLRFRPAYTLEDADFLVKALLYAKTVDSTEDILYRYRDTEGSLSKEQSLSGYADAQLDAIEAVYHVAFEYENYSKIQEAIEYMILCMYKNIVIKIMKDKKRNPDIKKYIKKTKEIRNNTVCIKPENNRFVKEKFDREDMFVINKADGSNNW